MARQPRFQHRDAIYHVISCGAAGRAILAGEENKWCARILLENVVRRHDVSCLSWCFLDTHYHLLAQTPNADIARAMQRFNGIYAQAYNKMHGTNGHVFAGRYWAWVIQSEEHLRNVARYIVLNPVRAGICATADEWKWSSHRSIVNDTPTFVDTAALLGYYGMEATAARTAYVEHVDAGHAQDAAAWPHPGTPLNRV